MNATETTLKTTGGLVQYFENETRLIEHYNRNGNLYRIIDGANGRELWHKGHNRLAGVIDTIPHR